MAAKGDTGYSLKKREIPRRTGQSWFLATSVHLEREAAIASHELENPALLEDAMEAFFDQAELVASMPI